MSIGSDFFVVCAIVLMSIVGVVLFELLSSRLPHTHWLSKLMHVKLNRRGGGGGGWDGDSGCGGGGGD